MYRIILIKIIHFSDPIDFHFSEQKNLQARIAYLQDVLPIFPVTSFNQSKPIERRFFSDFNISDLKYSTEQLMLGIQKLTEWFNITFL